MGSCLWLKCRLLTSGTKSSPSANAVGTKLRVVQAQCYYMLLPDNKRLHACVIHLAHNLLTCLPKISQVGAACPGGWRAMVWILEQDSFPSLTGSQLAKQDLHKGAIWLRPWVSMPRTCNQWRTPPLASWGSQHRPEEHAVLGVQPAILEIQWAPFLAYFWILPHTTIILKFRLLQDWFTAWRRNCHLQWKDRPQVGNKGTRKATG